MLIPLSKLPSFVVELKPRAPARFAAAQSDLSLWTAWCGEMQRKPVNDPEALDAVNKQKAG